MEHLVPVDVRPALFFEDMEFVEGPPVVAPLFYMHIALTQFQLEEKVSPQLTLGFTDHSYDEQSECTASSLLGIYTHPPKSNSQPVPTFYTCRQSLRINTDSSTGKTENEKSCARKTRRRRRVANQ